MGAAAGAQTMDARRQQELDDEAYARRLVMEELASIGGPRALASGAGSGAQFRSQGRGGSPARAVCPFCQSQNEFVTSSAGPVVLRCGSCSGQFQVPVPSPMEDVRQGIGAGTSLQVCRRCGAMNQFPTPAPNQPLPDVLCGFCGAVAPASSRSRRGGPLSAMESRLSEQAFRGSAAEGLMRMNGGPMVRVNVGGQRRVVPLMLLLALMAEESEAGNPAQAADIDALPTRKLAGNDNMGEQNKCLICLEEFGDGDDVKTLPCLHFYHQKCIEQWLGTDNSCPVCKTPIGQAAMQR